MKYRLVYGLKFLADGLRKGTAIKTQTIFLQKANSVLERNSGLSPLCIRAQR